MNVPVLKRSGTVAETKQACHLDDSAVLRVFQRMEREGIAVRQRIDWLGITLFPVRKEV